MQRTYWLRGYDNMDTDSNCSVQQAVSGADTQQEAIEVVQHLVEGISTENVVTHTYHTVVENTDQSNTTNMELMQMLKHMQECLSTQIGNIQTQCQASQQVLQAEIVQTRAEISQKYTELKQDVTQLDIAVTGMLEEITSVREELVQTRETTNTQVTELVTEFSEKLGIIESQVNEEINGVKHEFTGKIGSVHERLLRVESGHINFETSALDKANHIVNGQLENMKRQISDEFHALSKHTHEQITELRAVIQSRQLLDRDVVTNTPTRPIAGCDASSNNNEASEQVLHAENGGMSTASPSAINNNDPHVMVINQAINRSWVPELPTFSGRSNENPVSFLHKFQDYKKFCNLSNEHIFLCINTCFKGDPYFWWQLHRENVHSFDEFRQMFLSQYWSVSTQSHVRATIMTEHFTPGPNRSLEAHVSELYERTRHMTPPITDTEFITIVMCQLPINYRTHFAGDEGTDWPTFRKRLLAYCRLECENNHNTRHRDLHASDAHNHLPHNRRNVPLYNRDWRNQNHGNYHQTNGSPTNTRLYDQRNDMNHFNQQDHNTVYRSNKFPSGDNNNHSPNVNVIQSERNDSRNAWRPNNWRQGRFSQGRPYRNYRCNNYGSYSRSNTAYSHGEGEFTTEPSQTFPQTTGTALETAGGGIQDSGTCAQTTPAVEPIVHRGATYYNAGHSTVNLGNHVPLYGNAPVHSNEQINDTPISNQANASYNNTTHY